MKFSAWKKGFTLIEINLAIFILSAGVLLLIGLFALGFREQTQAREDLATASYADGIVNLVAGVLSSTNMKWSAWQNLSKYPVLGSGDHATYPSAGWGAYFTDASMRSPRGRSQMNSITSGAFAAIKSAAGTPEYSVPNPQLPSQLACALVVTFDGTRAIISARASLAPSLLLSQPLYYAEVRFQGDPNK